MLSCSKCYNTRARETAQESRELTALAEDPHNGSQPPVTPVPGALLTSYPYMGHTRSHKQTHIHINKPKFCTILANVLQNFSNSKKKKKHLQKRHED